MLNSQKLSGLNTKEIEIANGFSDSADNELFETQNENALFLNKLSQFVLKSPDEILLFILDEKERFLSCIKGMNIYPNLISYTIIALGKACSSDFHEKLNNILLCISTDVREILMTLQHYLVMLKKQKDIDKLQLDALINLTMFLRHFQLTLPSCSLDFISMLLPLLIVTCKKHTKDEEFEDIFSGRLKEIDEELKQFIQHFSVFEINNATEKEKQHLLEPPENYRSLPILPTLYDIHLPWPFLRPNITKGKYKNAEHYLDVQFRLLREDYIKPLRDGIAEYLCLKKNNKSLKNCKNVKVYCNASIVEKEFVKGDLIHLIKFKDQSFSTVNWENSKRFLTGSLLCLSSNDFHTILFATVAFREIKNLKKGLLCIHFEDLNEEVLSITSSTNFVVIETSAYFESYCHNLKALQTLNEKFLPMKRYIIDVQKSVQNPSYLKPVTTYDMRPLLIPLNEKYIKKKSRLFSDTVYEFPDDVINVAKSIRVADDSNWPLATDLNLDQSQYDALKSAVTKELAIIQGPPGTGKTYVGLRFIQLMLHNIHEWFNRGTNALPILIVCYTNHALDQFLEGVLLFTNKIVRIGGRGTNEAIEKYQISKLRDKKKSISRLLDELYDEINKTKSEIGDIYDKISKIKESMEDSKTTLIKQSDLENYIPSNHLESLLSGDFRQHYKLRQINNKIVDWLKAYQHGETSVKENQRQEINNPVSDTNVEIEAEGEADIEFIENQRNIDQYEFEDIFKKKGNILHKDEFQSQQKNKLNLEYIKYTLKNTVAMKHYRAKKIRNIWSLPIKVRWQLYKYWLEVFFDAQQMEYLDLQNKLKIAFKNLADLYVKRDLEVIRGSHIVGMTTTGAAKYRHIIKDMKPAILLVEEAAEILESHIITSLAAETKHVILIGDQQQLRPSPAVYMLAVKYDMNVSLFERMIKNGVEYCRLSIQHRMRPEIASLIVPHIYPNLKNHKIVTEFENIKGVNKNVFFLTHNINEMQIKDSKSKVNEHEAKFLIKLCKYLLLQGYKPSQITVLTTYSGQLFSLKKLATEELEGIRFTVVDNFQGEENDIILISFVRSNDEGEVGFLKVSNRICVALSRAKKGLYCIGNFELLAEKSNLWKKIVHTLADNKSIGPSLCLVCQNHPDVVSNVATDADFVNVPEGGCSQQCNYRLSCGHSCNLLCHVYDQAHKHINCEKPCNTVCEKGHQCPKKCFENCDFCPIMVDRTLSRCGHVINAPCGKQEDEIDCLEPCVKKCQRGHPCLKKCFEICEPCPVMFDRILSRCGHVMNAACGKSDYEIKCLKPCSNKCENGHTCLKKCFKMCKPCPIMIDRTLSRCGHVINAPCGKLDYEIKCLEPCAKKCVKGHNCPKKCFEPCGSCTVLEDKILKQCGHSVKAFCYWSEFLVGIKFRRCENKCSKTCEEGHQCKRKCYQVCGPCTFIVNKKLPDCGHSVKTYCSTKDIEIKCEAKCNKILSCGHECTNKCYEKCITKCIEAVEIASKVCGHILSVQCSFSETEEELQRMCSKSCKRVLLCGHICKGTCGSCHQGRLHIECQELCERILICGHKCQFRCYENCPPCIKPCENRCFHRKCPRKCGDPCVNCCKQCNWICQHKKCLRPCFELCDREPCNEPCKKKLPCNHSCIGFCGEPCPKICAVCDKDFHKNQFAEDIQNHGMYIYLEDCKHLFKEKDLNEWFISSEPKSVKMKTCPKCGTIIRKNVRFNNLIKTCIASIEKVKILMLHDREENMKIQRSLLEHLRLSHICYDDIRKPITNLLSSDNVRTIEELVKVGNIINIVAEVNTINITAEEETNFNTLEILYSHPHEMEIKNFSQYCWVWLKDFIIDNFLTVSDDQLEQLSTEIYRLNLIDTFVKFACEKPQASTLPEFEDCMQCLINYKPFCNDSIQTFKIIFRNLVSKVDSDMLNIPLKSFSCLAYVNFSQNWHLCLNGHLNFIKNHVENICYECEMSENDKKNKMTKAADIYLGDSLLPGKEQDLNFISESHSSKNINFEEVARSKSAYFIQSLSSKQLDISLESEKTSNEDTAENIDIENSYKSKSKAILLHLLSRKLNVLLAIEQSTKGLDERVRNSELHNTYRRQTKSEIFEENWNRDNFSNGRYNVTLRESFSNRKTDAEVKEHVKGSGAVPKSTKYDKKYCYGKKINKSYRDTFPENLFVKAHNWRLNDDTKYKLENKDLKMSYGKKEQNKSYRNAYSQNLSAKDHNWRLKDETKNKLENKDLKTTQRFKIQTMRDYQVSVQRPENKHSFTASRMYSYAFPRLKQLKYDNHYSEEKHEILSDQRDSQTDSKNSKQYKGYLSKKGY